MLALRASTPSAMQRLNCRKPVSHVTVRHSSSRLTTAAQPLHPRLHPVQRPSSATRCQKDGGVSSLTSSLSALKNTQDIDRLRYQARYVFSHFDADKDGVLNAQELSSFLQYAGGKAPSASDWTTKLTQINAQLGSSEMNGVSAPSCSFDKFVNVIRQQVDAAAAVPDYINSQLSREQLQKLGWDHGLSTKELSSAHWIFSLLDFNGDGYIAWQDLQSMPGVEGQIIQQKIGDDEDEAAPVDYTKYLTTYAKPRPVVLNVLCMVAHTAVIWLLFNTPLSDMVKFALVGFVVLQPRLVTKPVVYIYNIVSTLWGSFQANVRLAKQQGRGQFSFQQ